MPNTEYYNDRVVRQFVLGSALWGIIGMAAGVYAAAVAMFFWAVNYQQFDDLDTPGIVPIPEDSDPGEPRAD